MSYEDEQRMQEFRNELDEIYPEYTLGELTYLPSDILEHCDPIAFRVYFSDWDSEQETEED